MKPNQWNRNPEFVPRPTTTNFEGAPAYERSLDEQVLQCAMTGSTANLFYMNADANVDNMIDTFKKMNNTELFKKILVYARNEGYNRSAPICGLCVLSTKDVDAFREIAPQILKNPKDCQSFIDLCRSKKIREGMGRGIKKVINEQIEKLTEYHLLKYPDACLDMINVARPRASEYTTYLKTGVYSPHMEQVTAYETLKRTTNLEEALGCISYAGLPYEAVTSQLGKFGNAPKAWEMVMRNAPYLNLLRNLNTFYRHGVFNDATNVSYAVSQITNADKIQKTMTYPFQYYITWRNLVDAQKMSPIKKALEIALELSVMNVPEIEGNVCIATDCSNSMRWANVLGDKSVLQALDVASLFTAILSYRCVNKPLVVPFSDRIHSEGVGRNYFKTEGLMNRARSFDNFNGGTCLSMPVQLLSQSNVAVDKLIMFTDNEDWLQNSYNGDMFLKSFLDYKKKISPRCKAYLVQLTPDKNAVAPQNVRDISFIYGYSDKILDLVIEDSETQIKRIKNSSIDELKRGKRKA